MPIFTDRSRIESFQHCERERYLHYHAEGLGLSPTRNKLALVVGGAVHDGLKPVLEVMRNEEVVATYLGSSSAAPFMYELEEAAVKEALRSFHANFGAGLEMDGMERESLWTAARNPSAPGRDPLIDQLEASLGETYDQCIQCQNIETPDKHTQLELDATGPTSACSQCLGTSFKRLGDPEPLDPNAPPETVVTRFDKYLRAEQAALVEAMIRAYMRRRLRPLLEEYQILEVEREGVWTLASVDGPCNCGLNGAEDGHHTKGCTSQTQRRYILFQSRPDALLLKRATRTLEILSYKTGASVDARRRRDAERDMQGLSEGIEVEMRLAQWHAIAHRAFFSDSEEITRINQKECDRLMTPAMARFLSECADPPTIHAVRYEFLLKGDRYTDKKLSAEYGFEARHQRTPLLRVWIATSQPASGKNVAAFRRGDWSVSYDFVNDDGTLSTLSYKNWTNSPVWEQPGWTIKRWIDLLDQTSLVMSEGDPTMGTEPMPRGWGGPAQKMGFLKTHPLDDAFTEPVVVYRNDDDLRDMMEQIEAQEIRVARGVAIVAAAEDEGERRSLLNQHFQQTRRACSYPSDCAFVDICYGSDDIRALPLESGKYVRRTPHHAPELEATRAAQAKV